MRPFIIKEKETGDKYIVLNYETTTLAEIGDFYLITNCKTKEMTSIEVKKMLDNFLFVGLK